MPTKKPTLHLLCGKIAAGKSTLAAHLSDADGTVLIVEDDWLAALYADEMATAKDYVRCASNLRDIIGPHVVALLNTGVSVVLDFQANTVDSRSWMRALIDQAQSDHQLHVLVPPDEVCLARLRKRNASGDHPFAVSEDQFHRFSKYFVPPAPNEGFNLVFHDQ
ncbi:MAG: ATP-binding protein [Roseibium sp.]|nr:ATP-binding protein [Roseibium sp.]